MATSALAQSASNRYQRTTGPIHTISVLAVLGGWAFYGKIHADRLSVAANPNRVRFYMLTIVIEWVVFGLVAVGVRHSGAPLRSALFWEINGVLFAKCSGTLESLWHSG